MNNEPSRDDHPDSLEEGSPKMRNRKAPEGCNPQTGDDRSFHVNELGYEDEEDEQEDWFAPFRTRAIPVVPDPVGDEIQPMCNDEKQSGGDDIDRPRDETAAELADGTEKDPQEGKILPFPERRQAAPKTVDLASLSPGQVCDLLGVTKAQAKALLFIERDAISYDDVFVIDPDTGIRMTSTTREAFEGRGE